MENPVRYVPAAKRSHDMVWDRVSGECMTLDEFMEGRDYGEVIRDGRLAAELEMLDGTPRYACPYCKDAMAVRSKAIRARSEIRFYFDHLVLNGQANPGQAHTFKSPAAGQKKSRYWDTACFCSCKHGGRRGQCMPLATGIPSVRQKPRTLVRCAPVLLCLTA